MDVQWSELELLAVALRDDAALEIVESNIDVVGETRHYYFLWMSVYFTFVRLFEHRVKVSFFLFR